MPFLILATLKGNVRVMTFLLEKEVESVNVCDAHHGNTPLHYAVRALIGNCTDGGAGLSCAGLLAGRGPLESFLTFVIVSIAPRIHQVMMGGKGHTGRDAGPLAGQGRKRRRLARCVRACVPSFLQLSPFFPSFARLRPKTRHVLDQIRSPDEASPS
jgi:hypothetical protein